jgi:protein-S-isoprenylcysteine O-methyltransferase Ste14
MRASEFEFRYRFWIIGALFWAAFSCYFFDHGNAAAHLIELASGGAVDFDAASGRLALQLAFGAGAAVVAAGALLRTWASAYLASERVHDVDLRSEALVADGPYRFVRNPLYLGVILLALGIGPMASRLGFPLLVVGVFVFSLRLIGREEAGLLAAQGEPYAAYLRAVPRLWPALRPRVPAAGQEPRWGQAWAGEGFFWGMAAATAVFAVTLDIRLFQIAGLVLLGAYVLMLRVWRRVRERRARNDEPPS